MSETETKMIDNPEAVQFAQRLVSLANGFQLLYEASAKLRDSWVARGMSAKLPATSTEVYGFGSRAITGADVTRVLQRAIEFADDYEADGRAKLLSILAVAP